MNSDLVTILSHHGELKIIKSNNKIYFIYVQKNKDKWAPLYCEINHPINEVSKSTISNLKNIFEDKSIIRLIVNNVDLEIGYDISSTFGMYFSFETFDDTRYIDIPGQCIVAVDESNINYNKINRLFDELKVLTESKAKNNDNKSNTSKYTWTRRF